MVHVHFELFVRIMKKESFENYNHLIYNMWTLDIFIFQLIDTAKKMTQRLLRPIIYSYECDVNY